ncbi:hypothetical protein AVEN_84738-1 [Araneus ventricosus]|uniref:Secreted protein n=1 Tax=Araneus ventricosus TaxID=182803 RepID=A0A4Y2UKT9_ARAVE|nr:hypothetical protein AVEN_84738-1 [Araneus ventricosus]
MSTRFVRCWNVVWIAFLFKKFVKQVPEACRFSGGSSRDSLAFYSKISLSSEVEALISASASHSSDCRTTLVLFIGRISTFSSQIDLPVDGCFLLGSDELAG